jgi:hypothetical protein
LRGVAGGLTNPSRIPVPHQYSEIGLRCIPELP